jgi:hypothetical protein
MKISLSDNIPGNSNWFKFQKDTWTRFAILDTELEFEFVHYHNGYVVCTGERCQFCQHLGLEKSSKFAANIVVYRTDQSGRPYSANWGTDSFNIRQWSFGNEKWKTMKMATQACGGDLRKLDFLFQCSDAQYQKGTLMPQQDVWWLTNGPEFQKLVVNAYATQKAADLDQQIAKRIPYENQMNYIMNRQRNAANQGPGARPQMGQNNASFNPNNVLAQMGGTPQLVPGMPAVAHPSVSDVMPAVGVVGQDLDMDSMLADLGKK